METLLIILFIVVIILIRGLFKKDNEINLLNREIDRLTVENEFLKKEHQK